MGVLHTARQKRRGSGVPSWQYTAHPLLQAETDRLQPGPSSQSQRTLSPTSTAFIESARRLDFLHCITPMMESQIWRRASLSDKIINDLHALLGHCGERTLTSRRTAENGDATCLRFELNAH